MASPSRARTVPKSLVVASCLLVSINAGRIFGCMIAVQPKGWFSILQKCIR